MTEINDKMIEMGRMDTTVNQLNNNFRGDIDHISIINDPRENSEELHEWHEPKLFVKVSEIEVFHEVNRIVQQNNITASVELNVNEKHESK